MNLVFWIVYLAGVVGLFYLGFCVMLTDDQVRAQLKALDEFKKTSVGIAVWDLVQNVSGGLLGKMEDWPTHIREPIERAIERDCIPQAGWHR